MFVPNSWSVIYRVKFDGDNQNLQDDFESKDEALAYAKEHLDEKPVVLGYEVYIDELGSIIDEEVPEEIFSYIDEEELEEDNKLQSDKDLDKRLDDLLKDASDKEDCKDKHEADKLEKEKSEEAKEVKNVDNKEQLNDICLDCKEKEVDDYTYEPGIFETDFDVEVEPNGYDFSPADFLSELADALGIGDQVEISDVEEYTIPDVEEYEVVADDSAFSEIPNVAEETAEPIYFKFDSDFGSDYLDDEDEHDEQVDIPLEVEQAAASDEQVAVEAPCEGEECDPHLVDNSSVKVDNEGIEAPAEEISDCHVCPECGKEICECGNKELDEDTHPQEAQPDVAEEDAYNAAKIVADAEEKPVIYGYHGDNHHGKFRFFEIDQIICKDFDDLKQRTKEVINRYHPTADVAVAYPEVDTVKLNRDEYKPETSDWGNDKPEGPLKRTQFPKIDLSRDESLEEGTDLDGMSDEEFAEAFRKGLEEKHSKDCKK